MASASTNPNEDEEEAYSLVEDLSSLSDNVVIITTASAASEDKDVSEEHHQGGRGRSIQGKQ